MKILLIEDERRLGESLQAILENEGYAVDLVLDGEEGLAYAQSGVYDLLILDIMLPGLNGLDILSTLRGEKDLTPVLMLTAMGQREDKVTGLDRGADDYVTKPFDSAELLARVRALNRRAMGQAETGGIALGDLVFRSDSYELRCGTRSLPVTQKEGELLEYLLRNRGNLLSKEQILEKVWGFDSNAEYNHVEVYISFLRKKIAELGAKVQIRTVRGVGYQIEELA